MTNTLFDKIIITQDKLDISILKIEITKKQLEKFKKILIKKGMKSYKGVQPIDMLIGNWRRKKNLYCYGGIEIKIKND